jgi:peptide/nickel transport system permease protein
MRRWRGNPSLLIGGAISLTVVLIAVLAHWITWWPVDQMDMAHRFAGPSAQHLLGTDNFGRDLWTRIALGARISLAISVCSVALAVLIGGTLGMLAGYFGGWADLLLMRLVDIFLGFPSLLLALGLLAVLGPGWRNTTLALVASFWAEYARVARACVLALRDAEFVVAARAIGGTHAHVLRRTVLPNALGPIIVLATLGLGTAVVAESGLSFLGFGVPPPAPTWGWTLAYGTRYLRGAPWMASVAGLAIMITVLGFNLLGDGLRDWLDPRGQARRL